MLLRIVDIVFICVVLMFYSNNIGGIKPL